MVEQVVHEVLECFVGCQCRGCHVSCKSHDGITDVKSGPYCCVHEDTSPFSKGPMVLLNVLPCGSVGQEVGS